MFATYKEEKMPTPVYYAEQTISELCPPLACSGQLQLLLLASPAESQAIKRLLGSKYEVIVVDNIEQMSCCIGEHDFALLVIYPNSCAMSGVECIEQLKANPLSCDIPIIAVLAEHARAEEFATIQAGAIDCMVMPLKPVILSAKIHNHMALAERIKQLEVASCTDGLTGLHNRTQLETVLTREWFNARRGEHFISALMIDVDYFKDFNDTYGHLQGDECLKAIATIVQNTRRRGTDFAARFGGEEFVMILPFTDNTGAITLAQYLIEQVHNLALYNSANHLTPVTISVGVSTCSPHDMAENSDKPWQLIELADNKLYAAKQAGRDRFCT
jgi:diguanylate cyclase (GGDEF)-like protein